MIMMVILLGEAFTSREGFEEYRTLFATIYGNSYQDLKVVLLEGDKEVPTSTSLVFLQMRFMVLLTPH